MDALTMRKELLGPKHPDVVMSLNNVGGVFNELKNHEEALKYQIEALEIMKELYGENHPGIAIHFNNVGYTMMALGRYEEALTYLKKAVEIIETMFKTPPSNARMYYVNLVECLEALEKIKEAEPYIRKIYLSNILEQLTSRGIAIDSLPAETISRLLASLMNNRSPRAKEEKDD